MKLEVWKKQLLEILSERKDKLPILVVFFVGLIFIHQGIGSYKKYLGFGQSLTEVLVASKPLIEGQKLSDEDFHIQQVPSKYVPIGVLKPSDVSKITGYSLNRSITKDELVLWSSINLHYNYQSPSTKIEAGYRAVSVPVDTVSSVSNLIQTGDHVDIMTTFAIPGENKPSTLTLLQNVTVLSVGSASGSESSYTTITLMVLPVEAVMLSHSSKYGNLSFVLRNPMDIKTNQDLSIISDQEIVQTAFRNHLQAERDASSGSKK